MEDRVSLYPGRVTLTPVEGQPNTYDMVRADQPTQQGTALSKANLLKDTTAAQFGLGSEAVPDDVLGWIGKYNEYWWSLLHNSEYTYYIPTQSLYQDVIYVSDSSGNGTIYHSSSIIVDASTGKVSLVSPGTMVFESKGTSDQNTKKMQALYGQYISNFWYRDGTSPTDDIVWVMGDAGFTAEEANVGHSRFWESQTYKVFSEPASGSAGDITYAHSTDRNAYPDSGTEDGITYTFLGVPFENFPNAGQRKIAMGVYTGVGKYGSANKNMLTFSFEPLIVFIAANAASCGGAGTILIRGQTKSAGLGANYNDYSLKLTVAWSGKALLWYASDTADRQLNTSGTMYHYVALG